ncbi:DUF1156 domain-containing protein [Ottowia sp. SB7-C50]|uniref:DUF1156 domain-containing protein n=1 Tax=Ottowia sp. SB7-C50 TaxID=3081231 RepID=UPI0029551C88|nr:DUF1156 domain-containing protein [Ottowia sp. SB7-C50]WOP13982.1 DUF1156 domain-containing protein [Ottowia sp. SB7-C50]
MATQTKKLIEVALPLAAINAAAAREKSIRHGHPSTLHLWWARRPLAAARAVIFAQMVDDPSAWPDLFPTEDAQEAERQRLFRIIEELVKWENTTNETVLDAARAEIRQSWQRTCQANADHPRAAELFDPERLPANGGDVPDDLDARLVVLAPDCPHTKDGGSPAEAAAKAILETRGNAPRLYRNTLAFLAPDRTRLQDLDEAARRFLAWNSILADDETLGLTAHQKRQVEQQIASADAAAAARLPETYHWLLVPSQGQPTEPMRWEALRLTGNDALAVRAAKKLRSDGSYLVSYSPTLLKMELDRVPLWRGNHVSVKQLVEDYARYLYLPRLKDPASLLHAMSEGVGLLTWAQEGFGYADDFDPAAGRYKGLRGGTSVTLGDPYSAALLVKSDIAAMQLDAERAVLVPVGTGVPASPGETGSSGGAARSPSTPVAPQEVMPTRFHATATLDATRIGRDAGRIAEEIVAHLSSLIGAEVTVTLDIAALVPDGVPGNVVRVVRENCAALRIIPDFEDR